MFTVVLRGLWARKSRTGVRASTGTSIRQQVTAGYVITPQSDVLAPTCSMP